MNGPQFFAEALGELEDAVVYHEQKQRGLGARLVQVFDETMILVMEFPAAAPVAPEVPPKHEVRARLLLPFKIKVVYVVRQDTLLVIAVFHASRRPGYWAKRLVNFVVG